MTVGDLGNIVGLSREAGEASRDSADAHHQAIHAQLKAAVAAGGIDVGALSDIGTPASTDKVLMGDTSDSDTLKFADFSEFGGAGGSSYPVASEDVATTTYTFVAGDQNKIKTFTNAAAVTATVDGSVHAANDRITARAGGAGGTTLVEGTGMTFDPPGSVVLAEGQVADVIFTSATTADVYAATAASATEAGIVELADGSETSAGSDALRAVTPDGLAASRFGAKEVGIVAFASDVATAVGNGDIAYCVPASLNGMNLTAVVAAVHTAGTTGTTDVQVRRRRDTTDADMLSTKITIDSGETRSTTAATAAVINGTNDDVATGDLIFVDVDAIATTPANGLFVTLTFSMP